MATRQPTAIMARGLLFGLAAAAPYSERIKSREVVNSPSLPMNAGQDNSRSGLITADTTPAIPGLIPEDLSYMRDIGMAYQGENGDDGSRSSVWVGDDGPNTFTFRNAADVPAVLVIWESSDWDGASSFMNVRRPKITWSLASAAGSFSLPPSSPSSTSSSPAPSSSDDELRRRASEDDNASSITISMADGVTGGWSALFGRETMLNSWGQVAETWGEFVTGSDASSAMNLNYLVTNNREGTHNMTATATTTKRRNGWQADSCEVSFAQCSFHCRDSRRDSCGEEGSYVLRGCGGNDPITDLRATENHDTEEEDEAVQRQISGCRGWGRGGRVDVVLGLGAV